MTNGATRSSRSLRSTGRAGRSPSPAPGGTTTALPGTGTCRTAPGRRFAVENVLEELDRPGEWCLDSEEGKLYFWPPQGSIEGLEVVAPKLDRLVALERTSYVTLRGFTLTETIDGDDLHPGSVEGLGAMFSMQGTKYCGEAIHLNRAEWCRIENNRVYATGGNGIYLRGYNARNLIRHNEIA